MGQDNSASQRPPSPPTPPPPPPKTLTDDQWRPYISWTREFEKGILTDMKRLHPTEHPNLLMIGPVGSGKSSFINAIISIGKGRKYAMALTGDTGDTSCTSDFDQYTQAELLRGYNLMDSMGFEQRDNTGFHPDDIEFLVKGHIKRGYTFNPIRPITEENKGYYRRDPTLSDQCHCVIFVVSAIAMHDSIERAYMEKIKKINEKIRKEHVPRVLILTKVDQLCDEVEKEITLLFRSKKVLKAVKVAAEVFKIDQASIHPVKNYEVDYYVETKTNIPLLLALRQTMEYAVDRIEYVLSKKSEDD